MTLFRTPHNLTGLADPYGKGIGFLIPVFSAPGSNALRVERVDRNGRVQGFVDLDPQDTQTLPAPHSISEVGAKPHWAFGFGGHDLVVGIGEKNRSALHDRLDDGLLAERPLLALEVAEFLGLRRERIRTAIKALKRMREVTPDTADQWRDLSIFTPDLRAALARALPSGERRALLPNLHRLTAVIRSNIVEIGGIDKEQALPVLAIVEESVNRTLDKLSELYERPSRGWTLRFAPTRQNDREPSHRITAFVYVADERDEGFEKMGQIDQVDGISINPLNALQTFGNEEREFRGPRFVMFSLDAREPTPILTGTLGKTRRPPIGLAIRARSNELRPAEHRALERYQYPSVIISSRFSLGPYGARPVISGETRDAINLFSAANRQDYTDQLETEGTSYFFRSQGTGPNEVNDAWGQLYSRCWRLGAMASPGKHFEVGEEGKHSRSDIGQMLFPHLTPIRVKSSLNIRTRRNISAAILIAARSAGPNSDAQHHRNVVRVLKKQRWSIPVSKADSDRGLMIEGRRSSFRITTEWRINRLPRSYSFKELLDVDLGRTKRLLANEGATARMILSSLYEHGALLVTIRDLLTFPSGQGTIWTLFASQIRRLTRTLPAKATSQYFGLLVQAAIQQDNVDLEAAGHIIRSIHRSGFEDDSSLICSRVQYDDDRAFASMTLNEGQHGGVVRFQLEVTHSGVTLREPL